MPFLFTFQVYLKINNIMVANFREDFNVINNILVIRKNQIQNIV